MIAYLKSIARRLSGDKMTRAQIERRERRKANSRAYWQRRARELRAARERFAR